MSRSYHPYVVIGVPASTLIEAKRIEITHKIRIGGEVVFDALGNAKTRQIWIGYFTFLGKNYPEDHRTHEDCPILLESGFLWEEIEKTYKLKWISYDYGMVYKEDIVGVPVHWQGEKTGVPLSDLAGKFEEAKANLKAIGCEQPPLLYSAFHHSY